VAARVMHCLTMELRAALSRSFTACGKSPVVALTNVQIVIDVTVETILAVIPRPGADENAA
jgi:hypothetical protein